MENKGARQVSSCLAFDFSQGKSQTGVQLLQSPSPERAPVVCAASGPCWPLSASPWAPNSEPGQLHGHPFILYFPVQDKSCGSHELTRQPPTIATHVLDGSDRYNCDQPQSFKASATYMGFAELPAVPPYCLPIVLCSPFCRTDCKINHCQKHLQLALLKLCLLTCLLPVHAVQPPLMSCQLSAYSTVFCWFRLSPATHTVIMKLSAYCLGTPQLNANRHRVYQKHWQSRSFCSQEGRKASTKAC